MCSCILHTCCGLYYNKREQIHCIYGQRVRSTINLQSFISLCGIAIFYTANIAGKYHAAASTALSLMTEPERIITFETQYIWLRILLIRVLCCDITKYIAQVVSYAHNTCQVVVLRSVTLGCCSNESSARTICLVAVAVFYDES